MERIPVEVIANIGTEGEITPIRLRYEDKEGAHVVKVNRILQRDKQVSGYNINGFQSTVHSFCCEAAIDDRAIPFKLTFNTNSSKWYMHV